MARGRPKKDQGDVLMKSAEMIGWAIGGIEREILQTRERLSALTAQATKLRARVGAGTGTAAAAADSPAAGGAAAGRQRRRRKMSPESRQQISEAMKKRWAERRKKG